jgi:hypothetical protein
MLLDASWREDYSVAVAASLWIEDELARTPLEFGESREEYPAAGIQMRIGFARPFAVRFGVHEQSKNVFIRSFSWMNTA